MMHCREFEERVNLLLDERRPLEGDAALAAHAACCEPCRQLLAGQQAVLTGLRFGRASRVAPDFPRRVLARAEKEPVLDAVVLPDRRPSRRAWAVVVGFAGVAAAMLVAVSIAALNSVGDSNVAESQGNGNAQPLVVKRRGPERGVAVGGSPREKDKGNRAAPGRALSVFGQPPGVYRVAIADMASTLPGAVEKLDEVERYAPGIRPIRVSFSMLIDALWRTIPGMTPNESA
jgi:hypothetical protein